MNRPPSYARSPMHHVPLLREHARNRATGTSSYALRNYITPRSTARYVFGIHEDPRTVTASNYPLYFFSPTIKGESKNVDLV